MIASHLLVCCFFPGVSVDTPTGCSTCEKLHFSARSCVLCVQKWSNMWLHGVFLEPLRQTMLDRCWQDGSGRLIAVIHPCKGVLGFQTIKTNYQIVYTLAGLSPSPHGNPRSLIEKIYDAAGWENPYSWRFYIIRKSSINFKWLIFQHDGWSSKAANCASPVKRWYRNPVNSSII